MTTNNYSFCKFSFPTQKGKLIWEITNECNYACSYCIFASTGRKPMGELSTEQIKTVLLELKEKDFDYIKFTGGEPFLRPDMMEILIYAKELGFGLDISTNASLITREMSRQLSTLNLNFIHVSIDGHDAKSHELVRGKKTFQSTLNGLTNLLEFNNNIRLGCVLHIGNQDYIPEIIKFSNQLNVREIIFSKMEPLGRLKGKSNLVIDKEINQLIEEIEKEPTNIKVSHNLSSNKTVSFSSPKQEKITFCPGAEKFLFINSIGVVSPCPWVSERVPHYHQLSLHSSSLADILEGKLFNDFNQKKKNVQQSICPANHTDMFEDKLLSKFSKIYSFSTENLGYLFKLKLKDSQKLRALTITGSGDQAIILSYLGFKTVYNLDFNLNANYYAELKINALKILDFQSFKEFFLDCPTAFNYNVYKKIKPSLLPATQKFWDMIYLNNDYNGKKIRSSKLFNLKHDENDKKIRNSFYLICGLHYELAQKKVKEAEFHYYTKSVLEFGEESNFDLILLSNIADYSHKMFAADYVLAFKEQIAQKYMNKLNSNGLLMCAYIYDYHNINKSNLRNKINSPKLRKSHFELLGTYEEVLIESAIEGLLRDAACVIRKTNE